MSNVHTGIAQNVHTDIAQNVQKDVARHAMKEVITMKPRVRLIPIFTSLAGAVLLAVIFAAYLQPSFMLDLGSRFFMCF
jgi:hypothetical protein